MRYASGLSFEQETNVMSIDRRTFLRTTASAAAAAACISAMPRPVTAKTVNGMPYRRLGKTGEMVSLLCLGGSHIGMPSVTDQESIRMMRTAVDEGVNFFDNAYQYHAGRSEELMGKALKDGYRDKVFLMTKVLSRTREGAKHQLEESFRRLDVDVIDLVQMHSIKYEDDPRAVMEDGPLEVVLEAKQEGRVRYIGFTGHYVTSAHKDMLAQDFDWQTIQMPLSCFDYHFESFTREILPIATERGIGVIAMKTLGGSPGSVPRTGLVTVKEALHYSMNLPVATVCCGMTSMDELRQNLSIAKNFTPMEEDEVAGLLARVEPEAKDGRHEPHKTVWEQSRQKT